MRPIRIGVALLSWLAPLIVWAHSGSASYIDIRDAGRDADMTLALDLRDAQYVLNLDANADGRITWGELRTSEAALASWLEHRVSVQRDNRPCVLSVSDLKVDRIMETPFVVLETRVSCPVAGGLRLRSDLMFDLDVNHRSLIEWRRDATVSVAVLSRTSRAWNAPVDSNAFTQLRDFIGAGVWHIWMGFDHLAFLLVLLLPTFIAREGSAPRRDWRRLFGIVSAFTAAHSMTLGFAAVGVVTPPERPIEIAIAGSVVLAALMNLRARAHAVGVATAFGFGLLHGFGFASALQGLDAARGSLALALAGFNLGVEAGQLAVVAAVVPLLYHLGRRPIYAARVVPGLSLVIAIVGVGWIWERVAP